MRALCVMGDQEVNLTPLLPVDSGRCVGPNARSSMTCSGADQLSADRRLEAFFHVWSQKEAYLKARGDGVAFGLDHFDVAPDPDQPAALLADRREPGARGRWTLLSLDPGAGFRGAVAVEGAEPSVGRFGWE